MSGKLFLYTTEDIMRAFILGLTIASIWLPGAAIAECARLTTRSDSQNCKCGSWDRYWLINTSSTRGCRVKLLIEKSQGITNQTVHATVELKPDQEKPMLCQCFPHTMQNEYTSYSIESSTLLSRKAGR